MLNPKGSSSKDSLRIDLQQANSPVKASHDLKSPASDLISESISDRYKLSTPMEKPGIAKHANSVIDRHNNRLRQYGVSMPREQMYPYRKDSSQKDH